MSEIRLLPLVIGAVGAMLTLKAIALIVDGERFSGIASVWAQEAPAEQTQPAMSESVFGADESRSRPAILESLSERRQALDARERELDLREKLIEATRARLEARIVELRALESSIESRIASREEEDNERFAGLVSMYQSMKPRDAAKIFNGLEMSILARVAGLMNARNMAEILAAMDPEVAQRLTAELSAERRAPLEAEEGGDLPKIMGTLQDS
jgi:flagellar motility protein MotE (MotC chaperone)